MSLLDVLRGARGRHGPHGLCQGSAQVWLLHPVSEFGKAATCVVSPAPCTMSLFNEVQRVAEKSDFEGVKRRRSAYSPPFSIPRTWNLHV